MKIAISAESTIDLPKPLLQEFDIHTVPFTILLGDKVEKDGEVTPETMFAYTDKTGVLPKTSAVNTYQFEEHFNNLFEEGYEAIIHFSLSSAISSAYQNACIVASQKKNIYVIDTKSLSTGIALQAIYARRLAQIGKDPATIASLCEERKKNCQASFSLESVNYLYKGGRCSALAMIGANLLHLKPEIFVHSQDGKMYPGKKLRGPMLKVVNAYIDDVFEKYPHFDPYIAFTTFSSAPQDVIDAVKKRLYEKGFKRVEATFAGGTISSHCGPHCLGILYYADEEQKLD